MNVNTIIDKMFGWVDKGVEIGSGYLTNFPKMFVYILGGLVLSKMLKVNVKVGGKK